MFIGYQPAIIGPHVGGRAVKSVTPCQRQIPFRSFLLSLSRRNKIHYSNYMIFQLTQTKHPALYTIIIKFK